MCLNIVFSCLYCIKNPGGYSIGFWLDGWCLKSLLCQTKPQNQVKIFLFNLSPGQLFPSMAQLSPSLFTSWLPDTVEHVSPREDPDIKVWCQDFMESSNFLISKESVRHPHFAGISHCQVTDLI